MKKAVKYVIALILVFYINNNNLFSQEEGSWIEIDSFDRLEGEWEGTAISFVKSNIHNIEFESVLNISITFNYKKGDENVVSIIKIDFSDFITDLENIRGVRESGFTREKLWEVFKNELKDTSVIKFDHYSLFFENTELAAEYFASDSRGRFLINKNKDLLILIYFEPAFVIGIGDSGFTKMTFRKISNRS